MKTLKRINLKYYPAASLGCAAIFLSLSRSKEEFITIFIIYSVTILNLFMLSTAVIELTRVDVNSSALKTTSLFLGKLLFLVVALTLGVQIMGNRIIIPVLNYVFQIFIFILCFKKA